MVTYLVPVVATVVGIVVLNESLSWYQPSGALVVLAGVAVAQSGRRFSGRSREITAEPAHDDAPPVPAGGPGQRG